MDPYWLNEAEFSADQRKALAKKGAAMPDGSFPIRNKADLSNAVQAFGRAKNKSAVKAHIIKRARALGATDMLPDTWNISEADQSLSDQVSDVQDAWSAAVRSMQSTASSWVTDVFDDHVIVRWDEDYYTVPYSTDDAGEVTFDWESKSKVERQWVGVEAIHEAGGHLLESVDAKGLEWDVTIIKSGVSKNGRDYPPEVLKEAAPLFEGARVLARADDEHISGQGKSVTNIVGWLSNVSWDAKRKAIVGRLNMSEAADSLRTLMVDAWKRGKRDIVGLSIVAEGKGQRKVARGRSVLAVEAITRVSSVDIIFDPSAGGGLLKLVASEQEDNVDLYTMTREQITAKAEELTGKQIAEALGDEKLDDERKGWLREAVGIEAPKEPEKKPEPKADPAKPAADPKLTEAEDDKDDEDLVPSYLAKTVISSELQSTKLPEAVQARIRKRFEGKKFAMVDLTEAISDHVETFAELEKNGVIPVSSGSHGDPKVSVGMEEAQRGKAALDGFFAGEDIEVDGQKVPRYVSFKEAYIDLTGDTAVRGKLPRKGSASVGRLGLSEAEDRFEFSAMVVDEKSGDRFVEAVQSGTWTNALGDSITRQMVRDYSTLNLDTWSPLTDIVPVKDFRTQRRDRIGGYANLPTVAQNAAYTALTSPGDAEATYAVTKRGGTETITIEAIANDDVGAIRRIPMKLARAAAQTLHEFVFDLVRTNPTIFDGSALFVAGHNNIGATALSLTTVAAARVRMRKQADQSNSKRLGLLAKHLWVPLELEELAMELTLTDRRPGTFDNDVNVLQRWGLDYTVVDYWTDANDWFVTADKSQTPLIELGFYGPQEPELFLQDLPNVGDLFTNDRIVYKIRHIYGAAWLDWRGADGSLV